MVPEVEKERLNIKLFSLTAQLLSYHAYTMDIYNTWVLYQIIMFFDNVKLAAD